MVGAAAIGIALLATLPWFGAWTLGLFAASAANLLTLDRRMARSDHPESVVAFSLFFTEAILAVGVAFSGGGQSAALPWMVVPVGMAAARFRRQQLQASRESINGLAEGMATQHLVTKTDVLGMRKIRGIQCARLQRR